MLDRDNAVDALARRQGSALDPTRDVQIRARTGNSFLTLGHYAHADPNISRSFCTRSEDAFMLVYEFSDHPAHPILIDGREQEDAEAPSSTVRIRDLNHVYEVEHSYPLDSLHLHVPRQAMEELLAETKTPCPEVLGTKGDTPVFDGRIHSLAGALRHLASAAAHGDNLFRDHILFAALGHMVSCYGRQPVHQLKKGGLAPWQLRRTEDLIAARGGVVELVELAAACGLSVGYFMRAFKVSTGSTPHRWLSQHRIARAKQLLAQAKLPLSAIAEACGYADQSHFSKAFRSAVGMPPRSWRRRLSP